MAHELDFTTGNAAIAITWDGETPWHGYGQRVRDGATLDEWRVAAGLGWDVETRKVLYGVKDAEGKKKIEIYPDRKILLRTDTQGPLSIVSDSYHVVQPKDVLGFYEELIKQSGFTMHTAGALFGGKRIWALAKLGKETRVFGQDKIEGFLLLATSYDGTLATTGRYTSVAVVCNNTLQMALSGTNNSEFKLNHNKKFDADAAKAQLGLSQDAWEDFESKVVKLANTTVDLETAMAFFTKVLGKDAVTLDEESGKVVYSSTFEKMFSAFKNSPGADLRARKDTAWGLVNAVTFYQDHMAKSNKSGSRLNSAWFGTGAARKERALEVGLEIAQAA